VPEDNKKFPRIFVINSREGTAVEYPTPLDDPLDHAPELLILWARRTILYQDIKFVKNKVHEMNESVDDDSDKKAVNFVQILKQLKDELKVVKEKHD
jgi:hypothetical protein